MIHEIEQVIAGICTQLFDEQVVVSLTRTDEQFGDYATNVALQLSKKVGKNPREVAEQIVAELSGKSANVAKAEIAGPGFINLTLTEETLAKLVADGPSKPLAGKTAVAEYSDPNPFKVLHAGHLYTSIVGDAIANILEHAGATVHRVNFGGDVGLHVGKTLWGIVKKLEGEHPEQLADVAEDQRANWMAERYVEGTNAYEDDEQAKAEIIELNKKVYDFHAQNDHESPLAQIYWTCRTWSYDYFNAFYARIGTKFEKYYPESQTAPLGLKTVREHVGDVYEESDGAVVFDGEKHGLHTRVFINSNGLPTYEAKDVGLAMQKWEDYHFDKSVIITGNDIVEYMKVVMRSLEQFAPETVTNVTHLTHGQVKLSGGVKMSSRKGNFLRAVDVLEAAETAGKAMNESHDEHTSLGAVKYAFLKQRIGGDIIYEPEESVSLQGNSGPYLQYAHARARSVLAKKPASAQAKLADLDAAERSLLRKISEYPEVIDKALNELMPHGICAYLYELAQSFNRFYEHNRVIDDERETIRLTLVTMYADTLKSGLEILGMTAPERM